MQSFVNNFDVKKSGNVSPDNVCHSHLIIIIMVYCSQGL